MGDTRCAPHPPDDASVNSYVILPIFLDEQCVDPEDANLYDGQFIRDCPCEAGLKCEAEEERDNTVSSIQNFTHNNECNFCGNINKLETRNAIVLIFLTSFLYKKISLKFCVWQCTLSIKNF